MLKINWFPGHMRKAINEMQRLLPLVDSIIYVLDARAVLSCQNPIFDNLFYNKPILYVVNKIDKVTEKDLNSLKRYFKSKKIDVIFISATASKERDTIVKAILKSNKNTINKYKGMGLNKKLRVLVVGVPNTGKSTIINTLKQEKKAKIKNKAGTTRHVQWVRLDEGIELYDTPGTLVPNFEDMEIATKLAMIGSVGEFAINKDDLTIEILNYLMREEKNALEDRYSIKIEDEDTALSVMEKICQNRGFLLKGNEFDYERCFVTLIKEFRDGMIAKFMLDKV